MSVTALLLEISLASIVVASFSASFPHCISCPCGSSNQNYIQCIDDSLLKDFTCERWSHCKTCKANTTLCMTCSPNRSGASCSKIGECPVPVVDPNGIVEEFLLVPQRFRKSFKRGTNLTFKCRDGYDLKGSSIIRCLVRGQWSNPSPTCISRAPNPIVKCLDPDVDPNGRVNEFSLDPRIESQSFEQGTQLTFTCKDGYVLDGQSAITCGSNGRWSSPSPRCNITPANTYCENPGPIPNGRRDVFRSPIVTNQFPVNQDDFDFRFGTRLKYTCDDGFILLGKESIICEVNSYWSRSVPMCVKG